MVASGKGSAATGKSQTVLGAPQAATGLPDVTSIVCNARNLQHLHIFLLESLSSMVIFLVENVLPNSLEM